MIAGLSSRWQPAGYAGSGASVSSMSAVPNLAVAGLKIEAVKLVTERGVSAVQAARVFDVHENALRNWVKEFGFDPVRAFPGHGQMKPEQQKIERLRREVHKLKAERDTKKRPAVRCLPRLSRRWRPGGDFSKIVGNRLDANTSNTLILLSIFSGARRLVPPTPSLPD